MGIFHPQHIVSITTNIIPENILSLIFTGPKTPTSLTLAHIYASLWDPQLLNLMGPPITQQSPCFIGTKGPPLGNSHMHPSHPTPNLISPTAHPTFTDVSLGSPYSSPRSPRKLPPSPKPQPQQPLGTPTTPNLQLSPSHVVDPPNPTINLQH